MNSLTSHCNTQEFTRIGWLRQSMKLFLATFCVLCVCKAAVAQFHIDIDKPPFNYSDTVADNRVSRLIAAIENKDIELSHNWKNGYLESLLAALDIDASSQVLVFSKTSLQVRYITRNNPRAIYFNDDTYVGWVNGSSLMEISTVDPRLGAAFYLMEMSPRKPQIKRSGYECLGCHATSMTQGVPGHAVRSVVVGFDGAIRPQKESFVTDHSSPFSKRWGGWYVTGKHGEMEHMGNTFFRSEQLEILPKGNIDNLEREFNTGNYLSPYSDIVALMVLEHQSAMHNTLTRADFAIRQMNFDDSKSKTPQSNDQENTLQVRTLAKSIVDCMLFVNEFKLTSPVSGHEQFAKRFVNGGPKDSQGRSLREFDLQTRMFKYPCSYLIYSAAFDSLDLSLRREVYRQLLQILRGENDSEEYRHLDSQDRRCILEILTETKPSILSQL
ncbi:MAG: hypothetical protein U0930_02860 [Pirellulales bacterium]